jgi:hypothetical protein
MVWSPFSNLLLYGATSHIGDALAAGVRVSIGPDWSPTGSKNLLGELKVARLVSQSLGGLLSDRAIVALATRNAAAMVKWDGVLGSIEKGKRADLVVRSGTRGDPYAALLTAKETELSLVMINGVARYGETALMTKLQAAGEKITVGGGKRSLDLRQPTADPVVGAITLAKATTTLEDALRDLPRLARRAARPQAMASLASIEGPPVWFLALDELGNSGIELRSQLPMGHRVPMGSAKGAAKAPAKPPKLQPLELDPLTVADDGDFLARVATQKNLPDYVKSGLPHLY